MVPNRRHLYLFKFSFSFVLDCFALERKTLTILNLGPCPWGFAWVWAFVWFDCLEENNFLFTKISYCWSCKFHLLDFFFYYLQVTFSFCFFVLIVVISIIFFGGLILIHNIKVLIYSPMWDRHLKDSQKCWFYLNSLVFYFAFIFLRTPLSCAGL